MTGGRLWWRRSMVLAVAGLTGLALAAGPANAGPAPRHHGGPAARGRVTIFPSNALTVPDPRQLTGRRVALPLPDCGVSPTDCASVRQLNQLDGFDIDPRLALTFRRPVDPVAVAAATTIRPIGHYRSAAIGVDRVVWDASTDTVYAHPDQQLAPDTTYRIELRGDRASGRPSGQSVFTTESATIGLLDMRAQLDSGVAYRQAGIAPDQRGLHIDADVPAAGTTLTYTEDEGAAGGLHTVPVPNTSATDAGRYVFGSFLAPSWLNADSVIPATPTRGPGPVVTGRARLPFVLIVPAGPAPRGGWPVAVFGHGFTASDTNVFLAADLNAANGIATIGTDVVGHGFGPRSTWNITTANGTTTSVSAHARGVDQNGDGVITSTEGVSAPIQPALDAAVNDRDGLRQTVADVMSLVRSVGHGLGQPNDLRRSAISYYGQSFGGIYGVMLGGVDPRVPVLALNVSGGPITEIARLSPSFRPLVEQDLARRVPSLLNGGVDGFTESLPLRGQPAVLNPAPGAISVQTVLAEESWLDRSGGPEPYAPLLRSDPPRGSERKQVLFQNAFGDQTVPNPTNYTVLAAGHLFDRESLYRNDKTAQAATNPHTFLLDPSFVQGNLPGQQQIVTFFASGGKTIIDPDGAGLVWEVPIDDPAELLPLNF